MTAIATASKESRSDETRAHWALAHPSRVRILEELRSASEPVDIEILTARLGLHHNTVRAHLQILLEAGLVSRTPQERSEAGRPRWLFEAATPEQAGPYQLLAEILAAHIRDSERAPAAAAERAGRVWGQYLVERPAPNRSTNSRDAIATITDLMRRLGFEPESVQRRRRAQDNTSGPAMLLHRCPFRSIVEGAPDVICSVHLGLLKGALEEIRAPVRARRLDPFVEPSLCVAELEKTKEVASTR